MATFREMSLTPAEFARLAYLDKTQVDQLEKSGLLETVRRKVGNVERKMIPLEHIQGFFSRVRSTDFGRRGDQNGVEGLTEAGASAMESVATAITPKRVIPPAPKHK